MSIDTRLRLGLRANTEHLRPRVEVELETVLRRARRRTQWRVAAAVGVAAAAALVSVVRPGLDRGLEDAQIAEQPSLPKSVGDAPLQPGLYSAAFVGADSSTPRAVLEVPPGFKGFEGFAVTARRKAARSSSASGRRRRRPRNPAVPASTSTPDRR
jgi:hypothetical protein